MSSKNICFIVGNGAVNKQQFLTVYHKNSHLIAADGGANHLHRFELTPHSIIGDLDSLRQRAGWEQKTQVIHDPSQDSTDFEKCLTRVRAGHYLCFGFCGDRFDHAISILHYLLKYKHEKIIFFCGQDIFFFLPDKWEINLPVGTRVSLYPAKKTKIIHSSGLKYSPTNLTMEQGKRTGTSNESITKKIIIHQKTFGLAAILPWQYYRRVIKSL